MLILINIARMESTNINIAECRRGFYYNCRSIKHMVEIPFSLVVTICFRLSDIYEGSNTISISVTLADKWRLQTPG